MLGHRQLKIEDYKAILRRHWLWILVPAMVGPMIGYGISRLVPARYTSKTLVLVERQRVPDSFVKPVVTEDLGQRLATMQEQILSRTRLQPLIERYGLYKDDNLAIEDKLDRMRADISVQPVQSEMVSRNNRGVAGFYVTFTASDPRVAQQVCSEIASMFMSENLKQREQAAQGTTNFLTAQVEDAKRQLDEQDAKLAAFQKKYIGQLPSQENVNLQILGTLNSQLNAVTQNLNRLQQEKTYTESLLSQGIAARESQSGDNPETLQQQLDKLKAQLVTLQARYTSDYPDVIKTKNDIKALQDQIKAGNSKEQAGSSKPANLGPEPEDLQRLRAQVKSLDLGIKDKMREQRHIEQQISNYQGRVQLSPVVNEQLKSLTRDYQSALDFYNNLLAKKSESEMATDLERQQEGEQFRIMDPADLPNEPSFPNRSLFALGGLAIGAALGLGLVVIRELDDKLLRTEEDVAVLLDLPTLVLLPRVEEAGNGSWRRKKQAVERV